MTSYVTTRFALYDGRMLFSSTKVEEYENDLDLFNAMVREHGEHAEHIGNCLSGNGLVIEGSGEHGSLWYAAPPSLALAGSGGRGLMYSVHKRDDGYTADINLGFPLLLDGRYGGGIWSITDREMTSTRLLCHRIGYFEAPKQAEAAITGLLDSF